MGGNREYHVGGDLLDIHGNTIHGGFTGIRKDAAKGSAERARGPVADPDPRPGSGSGAGTSSGTASGAGEPE
ncbi:hypothetical protein AB0O51_29055 [Streptomyces sp. NPDC090301]|uniref:hypothetical protein n=1 Tax=Streptomyces sp. NPDC090301 TaxID=3154975 RepID=UPI00342D0F5C